MPKITLENATVEFTVGRERLTSLKSALLQVFRPRGGDSTTIRALEDITLSIHDSERVGIIGPNGAGKSTLLKVMARIYKPKSGRASTVGHVCPLFEFVTGFEMNASGWDNIRTRALLLGMTSREIEGKIGEIGSFSGLGDFLDLPVRTYSSGMLLRLAFSTSTAVDPEVLLLDEVMAAGDAEFIEKAKRRMSELIRKASIVIFATHSLAALPEMCDRTVWIEKGKIMADGPTAETVASYERAVAARL